VQAPLPVTLEELRSAPPSTWKVPRGSAVAYAGLSVAGLFFGALGWGWGDPDGQLGGLEQWGLVAFGALLTFGFGAALVQRLTFRTEVDGAGMLTVGGAVRRRSVDLQQLATVSLRPEGDRREHYDTTNLVVRDRQGRTVSMTLGWQPVGWEVLHHVAWEALRQGVVLSGPVRMALSMSDSPPLRRLLDVPSPPVTGPVACRRGPRSYAAKLHVRGWFAVVLTYALTLRPVADWRWWSWIMAIVAALLWAAAAWAAWRGVRGRLTIDEDGVMRAYGTRVDLRRLDIVDMGDVVSDGPYFERLAGLGLEEHLPVKDDGHNGIGSLRVEDKMRDDNTFGRVDLPLGDYWEPMGPLMSRLLHAVDERGLEVSEYVRYNLRFAAGQVPLSEHHEVVEATTGVDPRRRV
jgi:hypothetical protein